ncbi:MAG: CHASE2 domain-containing protein [Thiogranum sp.]
MRIETSPFARFVVRIVAYSLLGLFFLEFNPFGIDDKTDQATQDALYRVAAPFYESKAQQDVVVVLINQNSVTELYDREAIEANEWPIRYRDHAYLLSRIMKYRPRAVFVDVYFKQERSTDDSFDQFKRLLGRMSDRYETPLLFAGGYRDERHTVIQRKLGRLGEMVLNGWEGYGRTYPLKLKEPADTMTGNWDDHGQASAPDNAVRLTAAYRLYQLACGEKPLASCEGRPVNDAAITDGKAMSVLWGSRPANVVFREFSQSVCPDWGGKVMEVFRQIGRGISKGLYEGEGSVNTQCSYHSVIYADELVYIDKAGLETQKQALAAALRDKIVMYGVSLEGLHDSVYSPAHGQLPSVFFHAMALDNLMHYGDRYIRASGSLVDRINQGIWLAMTLLFSLVLYVFERRGFRFGGEQDHLAGGDDFACHISAFWLFMAAALFIIAAPILIFWWGRYEPLNSIGFLVLIGVSSWLVHSDFAERVLKMIGWSWRRLKVLANRWFGENKDQAGLRTDPFTRLQKQMQSVADLAESGSGRDGVLGKAVLLSSFSYFEAYVMDAIGEIFEFHDGADAMIEASRTRSDRSINSTDKKIEECKKGLQESFCGKKKKYTRLLRKRNYRFPSDLLSSYGLVKLRDELKNFRSIDVPELLSKGLHFDPGNKGVREFHRIRNIRNRIAHGSISELTVRDAMKCSRFLQDMADRIDRHIVKNYFVTEEYS